MASGADAGSGSAEPTWPGIRDQAVDWTPPTGPTIFVVPHPDDEVLLMGGLLARQLDAGAAVVVVAVTDGEAAYPGRAATALGRTRRREQQAALRELAGSAERAPAVIRLGLPDGGVAGAEPQLIEVLRTIVDHTSLVVAPWARDHHGDHEAAGQAAALVAAERSAELAAGLFWAWGRTPPAAGLRRLAVSDEHQARRRTAVAAHRSQLVGPDEATPPILSTPDLVPLAWGYEYYFVGRP